MNFKLKYMKYKNKYLTLKYKVGKGKKAAGAAKKKSKPVNMEEWDGPYQSKDLQNNRAYYIRKKDKLYALVDKKTGTLTGRVIELAEQAKEKAAKEVKNKVAREAKKEKKTGRAAAIAKMSESEKEYLGSIKNVEKYQDLLGKIYEKRAIITSELSKKGILIDFVRSGIYFFKVNDSFDNTSFRGPNIKLSDDMIRRHFKNIHEKESFEFLFDNVPNFDAKKYLIEWLKEKNFNKDVFSTATLKDLRELVEKYASNLRFLKMNKPKRKIISALKWFNQNIKDFDENNISILKDVNQDMLIEKRAWFESKGFKNIYQNKTSETLENLKKEYFDNLKIIKNKRNLGKNDLKWFNTNLQPGFKVEELKNKPIEAEYLEVQDDLEVSDDESVISEDQILRIKIDIINKIIDSLELFGVERKNLTDDLYGIIYENILNYMIFNYLNIHNSELEKVLTVNSLVRKIMNKIEADKKNVTSAYEILIQLIDNFMKNKYVLMNEDNRKITFNKLKLLNTIIKLSLHSYNEGKYNHIHVQYLERDNSGEIKVNGEQYTRYLYIKYNFISNEYNKLDLEEIIDPRQHNDRTRIRYKILLENKVKDFNREIKECIENNIF
jgi:hypothetical protein